MITSIQRTILARLIERMVALSDSLTGGGERPVRLYEIHQLTLSMIEMALIISGERESCEVTPHPVVDHEVDRDYIEALAAMGDPEACEVLYASGLTKGERE